MSIIDKMSNCDDVHNVDNGFEQEHLDNEHDETITKAIVPTSPVYNVARVRRRGWAEVPDLSVFADSSSEDEQPSPKPSPKRAKPGFSMKAIVLSKERCQSPKNQVRFQSPCAKPELGTELDESGDGESDDDDDDDDDDESGDGESGSHVSDKTQKYDGTEACLDLELEANNTNPLGKEDMSRKSKAAYKAAKKAKGKVKKGKGKRKSGGGKGAGRGRGSGGAVATPAKVAGRGKLAGGGKAAGRGPVLATRGVQTPDTPAKECWVKNVNLNLIVNSYTVFNMNL